ncbi:MULTISPECIES: DUF262 domain-containing protein [Actinoalloteichus]|uniref:GmrSD restriction endonucleases N-terminal domain-containing protein n=1 Tax=Actinoalloteichus fjordicus TaxID=1612552 RepID=A0AAC9LH43_9PSEU|nr:MULTISPECIES: DUF262 domain-containing protein [Actinoalloteichus]APU17216.1 Protein of unknown function DUF262 [Actinoalloteichus fjordicus]APU23299.1 Protein of unknown function DUF262 [Actinoalloteichus sp. GBA129-24]
MDRATPDGLAVSPSSIVVELDATGRDSGVELEEPNEIQHPFDPERIDVVTRTPTVSLLLSRIKRGSIDLAPDFQRKAGLWTEKAQSRLIESLLLRIPLPTFYAAENEGETWSIVDGIQRLTTIARFIEPASVDISPLRLSDLEYLREYEGFRFNQLPGRLMTRLEETEVVLHLIRHTTPEEVKFNVFGRINTGGLVLSQQELRHALIPGAARALLSALAQSPKFLTATARSVSPSRMADREMALRFLAFRRANPQEYSEQDFDAFLRKTMWELNSETEAERSRLAAEFDAAMTCAHDLFSYHTFRKQALGQRGRNPINKALFEATSVNLASRTPAQRSTLVAKKNIVNDDVVELLADPVFERAISVGTGDVGKVRARFQMFDEVLRRHDGTA